MDEFVARQSKLDCLVPLTITGTCRLMIITTFGTTYLVVQRGKKNEKTNSFVIKDRFLCETYSITHINMDTDGEIGEGNTNTNVSYENCPVCLETPLKPEETKTFPCNHEICQRCFVTHTNRSVRCPFCRRPIQDILSAKDEIILSMFSSLSDIERGLQKLSTCGFPKPLKNTTELRMRIDKIIKEMTNQGVYDNWTSGSNSPSAGTFYTRPWPGTGEDDLNTFFRFVGSFNNDFYRQANQTQR